MITEELKEHLDNIPVPATHTEEYATVVISQQLDWIINLLKIFIKEEANG